MSSQFKWSAQDLGARQNANECSQLFRQSLTETLRPFRHHGSFTRLTMLVLPGEVVSLFQVRGG